MIKKVALIGAGSIALRHLDAYRQLPNITVCAICDRDPERAEKIATETA